MMIKRNPVWILVNDGEIFEGHQGHWADCFFPNALPECILSFCLENGYKVTMREMTNEEVEKHPRAVRIAALVEAEAAAYWAAESARSK